MKNLWIAVVMLLFFTTCTQLEPELTGIGEVKFQSVLVDSFSGNLPNGKIAGPSTWKHIFKNPAVMEIKNKVTGQEYKFDYNPNQFGDGIKFPLPYGSYTYKTGVSGGAYEKYLPFKAEGEFNLGVANLEVKIQATTDYGLITVKNEYVKSLGIRNGSELCDFKLLPDESFYFIYAKKGQTAKLEIIESLTDKLIKRDIPIAAYNHYNFFLKKAELNGMVNFIELALTVFDYVEEGIEIGEGTGNSGLIFWNKLGSIEEVTNSEVGPDLFPGSAMEFQLGKYGKGIHIPQANGKRTVHSPYSPRNVIPLWSFAIEFWFKRTHDDEWDGHTFFHGAYENNGKGQVDLTGHSGYVGMWALYASVSDNEGNKVGTVTYNLQNQANWEAFYPKNEWVHLAISHDANWSLGQRIKIFRNGVELTGLKVTFETGVMSHVGQFGVGGIRLGNFIAWDKWGAGGVIDNIKIWDYPKTDFSDRNNEGN
ncbi:LamG-like jellyroll fold domain-containing protein [Cognataquiflexum aquatile]|uniref:LamG-like jellyroll fold domain-containing protein n=1 Tax=Cognataquiflexum aquatile TaxID=2249427 RepID=UPI000DE96F94|nr:LamG-like jellyroll fold domain-containing protein [Cognataquiflexum aquatile]